MGKEWDGWDSPASFQRWCLEWAREAYRVLKPGGHLLAFGGSRTWHRLACAIEDAGFELRDSIASMYGSGFPKSLDVSKAIDKAAWAQREVVGTIAAGSSSLNRVSRVQQGYRPNLTAFDGEDLPVTAPATDDARRWQGWGTALKPAFEPIVVARKPLAGTVAANVLAHGTGGINVDGCRVGNDVRAINRSTGVIVSGNESMAGPNTEREFYRTVEGRWPSNVVMSHSPLLDSNGQPIGDACADGCPDGCPVAELDAQSGVQRARGNVSPTNGGGGMYGHAVTTVHHGAGDSGGASRFFPTFRYTAKADGWERSLGTDKHPTVKPLELMRWLVRLVTPPDGLVLDQFAGSGTTLEAALMEGFNVIGCETFKPYLALIQARIERAHRQMEPGIAALPHKPPTQAPDQASLFDLLDDEDEVSA